MELTLASKLIFLLFVSTSGAKSLYETAQIKRDASQLHSSYDYIVVGGGTSGLMVADRLSEDKSKTVLVVEYGYLDFDPDILLPAPANNDRNMSRFYDYMSVPQTELLNQTTIVYAASIVGGGSAVDHMMFDRGSAEDYDNWEKLQNPGWGWKDLYPYFKKAVTFTPPTKAQQEQIGYTYDASAYGGNGPIKASYPPFQWPQQKIQWNAWLDLGITATLEGAAGTATGLFWIPSALDPKTMTRSYGTNEEYVPDSRRPNYHLLPGYEARTIIIENGCAVGVNLLARNSTLGTITRVSASQEVVLAAGSFGSPVLLQRSGIGPKKLLQSAGIDVKVNLPGVGNNLQDHAASLLLYGYANDIVPNQNTVTTNATFAAEVQAEYYQNKTGPMTVGYGNSVVFLPLSTINPNYSTIISTLRSQNSASFLPPSYDSTLTAGYLAQKSLLLASFASKGSAVMEVFFSGSPSIVTVLQKPLSRGTVTINTTSPYSSPVVDPRVFTNPIDLTNMVSMLRFGRKWFAAPSQAQLVPYEIIPGANVTADQGLIDAIRMYSTPTIGHALGTCAMMPREWGGVVDPELRVYGVDGLSVVDASIMPLAPATHTDATIYAIAEKGADLIKSRS